MNQNQTHIVLQGKGGVGKSFIASLIAQTLQSMDTNLLGIDTDPVNQTLARYRALPVRTLEILNADRQIDSRQFDQMIEWMLTHAGPVVVDNGATSFVPVTGYLAETGALDVLTDSGKQVVLHTVLVGGQAMDDTIAGFQALLQSSNAPVVVWENEFFGPVERDGRRFSESAMFSENRHRIAGIVTLRRRNLDTFGRDLTAMTSAGLTFSEALSSPDFGAMPKHRLKQIWADIAGQLAPVLKREAA
ncbi:conjugal transfer protein TraL [Laribacter hongkongensis]|uniref:nucleotide-binding protein n=1 Tax=Laribacter hongkongensis TaxID=168471 RepID=UPI001EFCB5F8|nr:conjugal transfer protein TraL [Laribacter hongkongensis]MCG9105601.1 conjugal transfer protein TraL [Laribacter hongkongensis]